MKSTIQSSSKVLNPVLYSRLVQVFGDVRIHNFNIPISAKLVTDCYGKDKLFIADRGEAYSVDCPFCGDTRKRLWINHRWGFGFPALGTKLWNLVICYNEDCLSDSENLKHLKRLVFENISLPCVQIAEPEHLVERTGVISLPSEAVPISEVELNYFPSLLSYLRTRNLDADFLWSKYKVHYCSENSYYSNRIIIPVFFEGRLVSWQARSVDGKLPKYLTCPQTKISNFLYCYDDIQHHDFCVLVEGPTDVWALESQTLAVFGSSLSIVQYNLLEEFKKVYVLFDADAENKSKKLKTKFNDPRLIVVTNVLETDPFDFCLKYGGEALWNEILKFH